MRDRLLRGPRGECGYNVFASSQTRMRGLRDHFQVRLGTLCWVRLPSRFPSFVWHHQPLPNNSSCQMESSGCDGCVTLGGTYEARLPQSPHRRVTCRYRSHRALDSLRLGVRSILSLPHEGQLKGSWSRSQRMSCKASSARYSLTPRRPMGQLQSGEGLTNLPGPDGGRQHRRCPPVADSPGSCYGRTDNTHA